MLILHSLEVLASAYPTCIFKAIFKTATNSIFKGCTATALKIIHCISLKVDRLLNESYFNEQPQFIVHPTQVANSSSGKESRKTFFWSA